MEVSRYFEKNIFSIKKKRYITKWSQCTLLNTNTYMKYIGTQYPQIDSLEGKLFNIKIPFIPPLS